MEQRTPSHRGGLQLPYNVGVSETEKRELYDKWSTFDAVRDSLKAKGFMNPPQPEFECPNIRPEHLLTSNSQEYSTTYAHLLAWLSYTSPILAEVRGQLIQAENQMTIIASKVKKQLRQKNKGLGLRDPDRVAENALDDEIMQDADYQYWMLEAQKWKQQRLVVEAFVENIDRSLKVVSRQVEIRKQEFESTRTDANMPSRGYTGRTVARL